MGRWVSAGSSHSYFICYPPPASDQRVRPRHGCQASQTTRGPPSCPRAARPASWWRTRCLTPTWRRRTWVSGRTTNGAGSELANDRTVSSTKESGSTTGATLFFCPFFWPSSVQEVWLWSDHVQGRVSRGGKVQEQHLDHLQQEEAPLPHSVGQVPGENRLGGERGAARVQNSPTKSGHSNFQVSSWPQEARPTQRRLQKIPSLSNFQPILTFEHPQYFDKIDEKL